MSFIDITWKSQRSEDFSGELRLGHKNVDGLVHSMAVPKYQHRAISKSAERISDAIRCDLIDQRIGVLQQTLSYAIWQYCRCLQIS
jgi:hypothetical protein